MNPRFAKRYYGPITDAKPSTAKAITPEQLAAAGTEHAHQTALFCWAAEQGKLPGWGALALMYAIPNGGARHAATANKLKAEGVKAGVPDICLPVARSRYHGLYVELKRPKSVGKRKGVVADEQDTFAAKLREQGYLVEVAIGFEAAIAVIKRYFELPTSN